MRHFISVFFVLALAIISSSTVSLAARVTLVMPDAAESGNSVPVRVKLDRPLAENAILTIRANSQIAAQVTAEDSVGLTGFETHVRLLCNECTVSASLDVDGVIADVVDKKLKVIQAGHIPEIEDDGDHKVHVRSRGHDLKVMINKQMSQNTYVAQIKVRTNDGAIIVRTTPYLSPFSYFGFQSNNSFDGISAYNVDWWSSKQ